MELTVKWEEMARVEDLSPLSYLNLSYTGAVKGHLPFSQVVARMNWAQYKLYKSMSSLFSCLQPDYRKEEKGRPRTAGAYQLDQGSKRKEMLGDKVRYPGTDSSAAASGHNCETPCWMFSQRATQRFKMFPITAKHTLLWCSLPDF